MSARGTLPEPGVLAGRLEWAIRGRTLALDGPVVMGIVNVTPDSFSDGGEFLEMGRALRHAEQLAADGAAILDVGGESTRPGADPVPVEEELARVVPVIRALKREIDLPVSIDTRRAEVARAAVAEGAEIVNDVSALGDAEMAVVVAEAGVGVVLMHMRGTPRTMQIDPRYDDVVAEVGRELAEARERAVRAGIAEERIVVDPGIGFGKTIDHNLALIDGIREVARLAGAPVLLGPSRKAFLGELLGGAPPQERAVATAAACVAGYLRGARLFRVHDVRPVREALAVAAAVDGAGSR